MVTLYLYDGVVGAELVVVYAGEEEVALVELHDEVVRVLWVSSYMTYAKLLLFGPPSHPAPLSAFGTDIQR